MTNSLVLPHGRLRSLLTHWQGQPVFLTVSASNLIIFPPHLNTANLPSKRKFSTFLHGHSKQPTKSQKKFFTAENEYVFCAQQRSKSKKGKSFSELAEQYGSHRSREGKKEACSFAERKNRTNQDPTNYQFQFPKSSLKPLKKTPKYIIPDEGLVEQQISLKIEESLKDLNTHFSEGMVRKIQLLKREMVEKIVQEGCESPEEFGEIINEIRLATEQIISNHSRKHSELQMTQANFEKMPPDQPPLQKQLFSFEGQKDELPEKVTEDKCSLIKLPEFNDDSGNISSILSENNSINKVQNEKRLGINEVQNGEIVEGKNEEQQEKKLQIVFNKENIEKENSFQQEHTVATTENKQKSPKVELQPSPQVKDYKIQFRDSGVRESQIVRLSPLRFRRKEEVVKHLVKQRIVEKESNSFEFVH